MTTYKVIKPGEIPTPQLHGFLLGSVAPRPIAFVSTIDKEGNHNLAPFSFFNVFSAHPPVVIFSPARRVRGNTTKHTLENILEVPEAVINMVSYEMVEQMNLASTDYPKGVDEFTKAGFTGVPSDLVKPLRVAESPVQMECKIIEVKPLSNEGGAGNLIIAEVLRLHIKEDILDESGVIDPHKIDLVSRMGANYYARASGDAVFEVEKPLRKMGIGIDALPDAIRNSTVLTGNDLGKLGNTESLPEASEISAFATAWKQENAGHLPANRDALHQWVHEKLLPTNQKSEALKLLLGEAYILG